MLHLIIELSKYLMILLFVLYAYFGFAVLGVRKESWQNMIYKNQTTCMFLIHLDAFLVLFAVKQELKILIFYGAQVGLFLILFLIYRGIYKKAARLVVNHMCMLLTVSFIILTRLNFDAALRQFEIAVIAAVVSALVPLLVRKLKFLRKFTWVYAIAGILALGAVLVLGSITGGAHLSFTVAGVTLQPSEFVKIIFVFFVACMLYDEPDFRRVCVTTAAAAVHVLILVLSTDLGAALIFFVAYIVMLYVATRRPIYFFGGLGLGAAAALAASKLFSHVQVRIAAWKDPFDNISGGGWQVAQSLFAIGTGSWFGLGLFQGIPETIPVGTSDFVFAAIVEEMGIVFGICIILISLSCFLMFLNIAVQIHDPFYKLIALGLGSVYGIQVFLNVGGVIKCIPSTGVTLPLVSYGGSSILCTMIMFAIIQGLYILRQDEEDSEEHYERKVRKKEKIVSGRDRSERKRSGKEAGESKARERQPESVPGKKQRKKQEEIEEIW